MKGDLHAQAGHQKPAARREPRSGERAHGLQLKVKPAASSYSQSGGRAAHVTAKATPVTGAPKSVASSGGVWGAARVSGEARNTRDPSAPPGGLEPREKVRQLQRRLWAAAKRAPGRRFHALYDHIWRGDVLQEAWRRVRSNRGAAGVDGQSIRDVEQYGVERFLEELGSELQAGKYRAQVVRRRYIPKADGKKRPLGIPTVRDRVAQMAAKLVLEPVFEADFLPCSYGFRPKRSATMALETLRKLGAKGGHYVLDADIRDYFGSIDHEKLLKLVGLRISDRGMLKLLRQWLEVGVMNEGAVERTVAGTPQGGVITPRTQKVTFSSTVSLTGGGTCRCLTLDVNGNTYMTYVKSHCRRKGRAIERCAPPRRPRVERAGCGADPDPRVRSIAASSISVRAGGPGDWPSGAGDRVVDPGDVQDPCERCSRPANIRSLERTDAGADCHPRDHGLPRRRGQAWLSAKDAQATTRFASTTSSIGACRASSPRRTSFSSQTACESLVSEAA